MVYVASVQRANSPPPSVKVQKILGDLVEIGATPHKFVSVKCTKIRAEFSLFQVLDPYAFPAVDIGAL